MSYRSNRSSGSRWIDSKTLRVDDGIDLVYDDEGKPYYAIVENTRGLDERTLEFALTEKGFNLWCDSTTWRRDKSFSTCVVHEEEYVLNASPKLPAGIVETDPPETETHKYVSELGGRGHGNATWAWVRKRFGTPKEGYYEGHRLYLSVRPFDAQSQWLRELEQEFTPDALKDARAYGIELMQSEPKVQGFWIDGYLDMYWHERKGRFDMPMINLGRYERENAMRPNARGYSAKHVSDLSRKSLSELRRMQDLNSQQIAMAHQQRRTDALDELRAREREIQAAIDAVAFGSKGSTREPSDYDPEAQPSGPSGDRTRHHGISRFTRNAMRAQVTVKSLTDSQIRKLRQEAIDAADWMMLVICDLALEGSLDLDDYTVIDSARDRRRLEAMTREDAYVEIVDAINDTHYYARGDYEENSSDYWVWAVDKKNQPLTSEGPWGPYDFKAARDFARISATKGTHDRAVSLGSDPASRSFEVMRVYKAGSGEHAYGVAQRIGAPMSANRRHGSR